MSWILTKKLAPYVLAVVGIIIAYFWAYNNGAASRQSEITSLTVSLATYKQTQASNLSAIEVLNKRNTACVADKAANEEKARQKQKELVEWNALMQGNYDKLRKERDKLYEQNKEVHDWGEQRVPAPLVNELFLSTSGGDKNN